MTTMLASSPEEIVREHQIFWMLVTKTSRRDDVARTYLAIQSALAHAQDTVNVGQLIAALMPEGRVALDAFCDPLGASGLAYFHWLFEVDLASPGEADYHQYRFRRRHDGATTLAWIRTAAFPKSLQFQQEYERQRRKLETRRAALLAVYSRRPHTATATNESAHP